MVKAIHTGYAGPATGKDNAGLGYRKVIGVHHGSTPLQRALEMERRARQAGLNAEESLNGISTLPETTRSSET